MNTLTETLIGARRRPAAFAAAKTCVLAVLLIVIGLGLAPKTAQATDMTVYTDSLQNGWQDWSWTAHNLANTSPVQSGAASVAVTFGAYQGLYFEHGAFDTTPYTALTFWIDGGTTGGQHFSVSALNGSNAPYTVVPITNYVPGGVIPANRWVQVTIPLSDLQVADTSDFAGFWLQDTTGGTQPTLYVDTITLTGQAAPAVVHLAVTANETLQTVDSRVFGVNTAAWDGNLDSANTQTLMNAAGAGAFRYPGGSWADGFDFTKANYSGMPTTAAFGDLTQKTNAQGFIIVNYGSGSPQMAAAWVAYSNASAGSPVAIGLDSAGRDWKTAGYWAALRGATPLQTDDGLNLLRAGHAAPYGFKNWELGNECYGTWENDTHASKQDPVTYAGFAQQASALMKQVDPTIKTGVVVTASEDDWGNQTKTVTNPVTGTQHKGWSSVLYSTLNGLNFVPDFVIYHNYAQGPGGESDSSLLQYASSWTTDATDIRTMLTQYFGASKAAHSELICTENNSVSYNPGKQTTSLVNGLFYADSIGSLLQTEFKGLVWWNTRNAVQTGDNNASGLYGWRQYGDYGILASAASQPGAAQDTPYPTYFALKLVSNFARGGDAIVPVTSDYASLSAYACKRANGDLSLLVINKTPASDLNASIALTGYTPSATATMVQYGETQDTAQSTGATVDLAQSPLPGVAPTFSATFPPYSMTVVTLTPATAKPPAPTITAYSPTSGPVGTVVTVTGTNLKGVTAVRFHNTNATVFSANAAGTQVTATVPSGATSGVVTATTPAGSAKTAKAFKVK